MSFLTHLPKYLKQVMLKQVIVNRAKLKEQLELAKGLEREEIKKAILEKNERIDRLKKSLEEQWIGGK